MSVIYRPVEQLLSRTIADRRARGLAGRAPAADAGADPGGVRAAFLVVALALHGPIEDGLFDGAVGAVLGAGRARRWPTRRATSPAAGSPGTSGSALYGGLVLFESLVAVLLPGRGGGRDRDRADRGRAGHRGGAARVAGRDPVGAAAATRRRAASRRRARRATAARCARARASPVAVAAIQLAEQTLLNAAVLLVARRPTQRRGVVFNALLIARAPLQLFQAVQTLAAAPPRRPGGDRGPRGVRARRSGSRSWRSPRSRAPCALGLLVIGPLAMDVLFDDRHDYGRVGLAVVAVGMGLHLAAGTLNQAALARGRARAGRCWLGAAAAFVVWMRCRRGRRAGARRGRLRGGGGAAVRVVDGLYRRRPARP